MVCKITLLIGALVVIMVSTIEANSVNSHARCSCSGCRPQHFTCDYNHFGGCDCAHCRCIWRPSPPSRTCCSTCKSMWGSKRKCWKCPVSRGCNYRSCGCY